MITNKHNGKSYIGYSIRMRKRIQDHFSDLKRNTHNYGKLMQTDWNNGDTHWICVSLEITNDKDREKFWIEYYNTGLEGYNEKIQNFLSESMKHKIGNSNKGKLSGRKLSEAVKLNLRNKNLGKSLSEETKKKLSIIAKNRVLSDETKLKISQSLRKRRN